MIRTTLAQATAFVLQKNFLSRPFGGDVSDLAYHLAGLPAPAPETPYLAAFTRLADFAPAHLSSALSDPRTLINSPLLRTSPYLVTLDQFLPWYAATARQRSQAFNAEFRLWGIESNAEIEAVGDEILARLDEPAPAGAIAAQLPPALNKTYTQTSRGGRISTTDSVSLALRWLVARGRLAVTNRAAAWWDEENWYAPLSDWYPGLDLAAAPGEAEAQRQVVRAYLAAFGPVTEADISFWTGFGKSETARATAALGGETTLTMVQGLPGMLLLLKAQAEALQSTPPPAEPLVNILPADDPYLTAHRASRSRYFSDQTLQRRVFSSSGAAKPAILVNGQVVGLWQWQIEADRHHLRWQLLADADPALLPLIQAALERTAAFIDPGAAIEQTGL